MAAVEEKKKERERERKRAKERSLECSLKVPLSAGGQNNLNKHAGCERCSLGSHLSMCLFFPAAPSAVPTLPVAQSRNSPLGFALQLFK